MASIKFCVKSTFPFEGLGRNNFAPRHFHQLGVYVHELSVVCLPKKA